MDKITFPFRPRMRGEKVTDLQDGLKLLLERDVIGMRDADRQKLAEGIIEERCKGYFGAKTRDLL